MCYARGLQGELKTRDAALKLKQLLAYRWHGILAGMAA